MDLIKESPIIHKSLLKRWEELEQYPAAIIKDAEERGMTLTKSQMSNYYKNRTHLTQKQVLWLCLRYGIPIQITIGSPTIESEKIKYIIPQYNELECIKNLNKHKNLFE